MKHIRKFFIFFFTVISAIFFTGFSEEDKIDYQVTYQNNEKTLDCYYNEEGILLLPLQDMMELLGYNCVECARCGKDEIYKEDSVDVKGHIYVNWYKNVITYSNDPTIVLMDANNEKIDMLTYTSSMLYQYLGVSISVNEDDKSIMVSDGAEADITTEGNSSTDHSGLDDGKIVYVYDPACSSCKTITALLDKLQEGKEITVIKIDATMDGNQQDISKYEEECKVPKEIQGIYPILFIRGEYLFHTEITDGNIQSLMNGTPVEHNIISGTASSLTDTTGRSGQGDEALIYFYSTTCASCKSAVDYINMMKKRYPDLDIVGYNLYIPKNLTLLKAYGRKYGLNSEEIGNIPAVFLSETALIGEAEILEGLEDVITAYDVSKPTMVLNPQTVLLEKNILNGLAVFGAGLLNGINPCSLSMFLFLLSLIMTDLKKILKIGLSFCFGKFLMFFLLGSVFYEFISKIDNRIITFLTKDLLIIFIIAFAVLNMNDYIRAKQEKYNKMVLQLPSWLKGFNQRIMKNAAKYTGSRYIVVLMIFIGMLLAFGEFLCTGQIYLTSIVVLIQGSSVEWLAVFYLILYSIAFILPLIILIIFVYIGKKVFHLSEKLLEKLPLIKIISSFIFILFGIYVVFG